jgi:hypothetical protein
MTQFKAFANNVEVSGGVVLTFVAALSWNPALALEVLANHGIVNPQTDLWYPHQALLDVYREIDETMGSHTLYQIGSKIPENAILPSGLDSIEKMLNIIDVGYHMNHRGGDIGSYVLTQIESNRAVMVCRNPYPCDFDRGLLVGSLRGFSGVTTLASERHDESQGCRKLGGESCTYILEWALFGQRKASSSSGYPYQNQKI